MKEFKIHAFIHVPFEGQGCIGQWINDNNHSISYTHFYEAYQLPEIDNLDLLIVMGGPMGIYDEGQYPWLADEKAFIRQAIDMEKTVIGICLGSQLIAEVLGAKVYPNHQKEIGWFDVRLSETASNLQLFKGFEEQFPVFHWHGDTYDIPAGCTSLISSDTCINQAFLYHDNVLGLQFHLEVTPQSLQDMVDHGKEELVVNNTIQSAEAILGETRHIAENNQKMFQLLDYFVLNQKSKELR